MKEVDSDFMLRVLRCFGDFECPPNNMLSWRTDGEFVPITFSVVIGGLFNEDGYNDHITISPNNINLLEQSIKDVIQIDYLWGFIGAVLFCCRVEKQKPYGYKDWMDEKFHYLFEDVENYVERH